MVSVRRNILPLALPLLLLATSCAPAYRPAVRALDEGGPVEVLVPRGELERVGGDAEGTPIAVPEGYRVLAEDVARILSEAWPEAQVVVADEPGAQGGTVSMMLVVGGAHYAENNELAPQVSIIPVQGSASHRLGKQPRILGQVRLISDDPQEGLERAMGPLRQVIQRAMAAWIRELQEAR